MLKYELIPAKTDTKRYIVLLHGFGGNHNVWKHQIPVLSKYVNVLAIDLPSHNENNIKLSDMPETIDAVCKEIISVLNELDIEKAVFMGLSLGTVFIKHMELYYPEYIEFAILVGAVGMLNQFFSMIVSIFSKIGDKLPFRLVYRIFSKIIMPANSSGKSRDIFCKCARALNAREFRSYMHIFKESIAMNRKFKLLHPLKNLYISGDKDICFLSEIKRESKITGSELIEMQQCGHVCNIDKIADFNQIIEQFLIRKFCIA